jgi:hypothetical protein
VPCDILSRRVYAREPSTPGACRSPRRTAGQGTYTQLDANLSYAQRFRDMDLTWFTIGKNLLDEDMRA